MIDKFTMTSPVPCGEPRLSLARGTGHDPEPLALSRVGVFAYFKEMPKSWLGGHQQHQRSSCFSCCLCSRI